MNSEWIQEGETSPEIIQFHAPSFTIQCFIKGAVVTAFYNPTVGVNIISASFASNYSSKKHVTPTTKSLRIGSNSIIKGIGIMQDVPVWQMKTEIALDFHIFEVQDFDILIGHPIEKTFPRCFYSWKVRRVSWGKILLLAYQPNQKLHGRFRSPRRTNWGSVGSHARRWL